MRAPLSGSTGSGEGTGDGSRDGGSRDGSTRDGDSDEAPTLSGRVTGLRSARQRPKRLTPDEVSTHPTFTPCCMLDKLWANMVTHWVAL